MTTSIGARVRRKDDRRLLTGRGRYVDDVRIDGLLHAAIVRSPHAHAHIRAIDTREAGRLPGVVAVLQRATGRSAAPGTRRRPSRRRR